MKVVYVCHGIIWNTRIMYLQSVKGMQNRKPYLNPKMAESFRPLSLAPTPRVPRIRARS